eukprot:Blabericola_migrator_1__11697@NODE_706_length_6785_cov_21_874367_g503_i1_p1_GENE_NODE_706_length_6785_cov_21_874367_g503_i1NODE_706_length_6785_cov_21_874367_g503_i1_p1_ORF_typecomplete_len567_score109_73AspBHydro_N/PF05279_11/0_022CDC27/PF09507_10/0_056KAR9/PF08580_10/2_1DMP1/PF07263_11/2_3_NODE_706_length_6785_cov_21_874367_g503_i114963196
MKPLIHRLTVLHLITLIFTFLNGHVAAGSSKRPAIIYSFEETGTMSDSYVLFRSVYAELIRLVGVDAKKAQAKGLHVFWPKPDKVPSSDTTLSEHLVEPDDDRETWKLMDEIPSAIGEEYSAVAFNVDPDDLKKAPITHAEKSNGISEILDKMLNYEWPSGAAPLLHVIFTDRVPHFRGYNNDSPFDEQSVLWDDLMSSQSGYPSVEEAMAKVKSSPIFENYYAILLTQTTTDRLDTRQAWRQALHAIGLDGKFSVDYLPLEQSDKLQKAVLSAVESAMDAYTDGAQLPVMQLPNWQTTTSSTTTSTTTTPTTTTPTTTTPTTTTPTTTTPTTTTPTTTTTTPTTTTPTTTTPTTTTPTTTTPTTTTPTTTTPTTTTPTTTSTTEESTTEESTTEESTTEESTTEESTTEESTTEESTTEESTTEESTTEESTTEESTTTESTTSKFVTEATVVELTTSVVITTESTTSEMSGIISLITTTPTPTTTTENATKAILGVHAVEGGRSNVKIALAGAGAGIAILLAAAAYALMGSGGGSPDVQYREDLVGSGDTPERETLVRIGEEDF